VLVLNASAWPHTFVRTAEAITVFGSTVLSHAPHSPGTAPSDSHIYDRKKVCDDTIMRTTRHYINNAVH